MSAEFTVKCAQRTNNLTVAVINQKKPARNRVHFGPGGDTAGVALGNALTHEPLYPYAVKDPVFTSSLTLLQLNAEHQKRWRRQFDDASELISGMSRLPL